MKRVTLALTLAALIAGAQPGYASDPYRDDPVIAAPESTGPSAWTVEPAPVAPPPGIYLVTDTYAGDSVTRTGLVTTYSTETVHETTGSYARVLESVATGGASAYDGTAFNGRAAMSDGRAVAGTYYENYIWTDAGFVPVSVVFFQDDSEIAREQSARGAQPTGAAPRRPAAPVPAAGQPAVLVGPPDDGGPAPVAPAPSRIRPSALLPDRSIEILRGRRTTVSFVGEDVRSWRFLSGECVALGALTGTASEPFVARWDLLAEPNATWVVRFVVAYADGTSHERVLRVTVRAPGLVE
jgi:hypothetical protein